jgi:nucleotide-binding universal stress UspA family protein
VHEYLVHGHTKGIAMCTPSSGATTSERIVIAVDDSAPSNWAVQTGARLAERLGARVLLLHVVVPRTAVMDVPISAEELDEAARREGAMLLERLRSELPASLHCDCFQLSGNVAEEIVEAADSSEAAFIVMGTRGRGRISHFLLGSTAEAVVRTASCPVLTVSHEPRHAKKKCCGKCAAGQNSETSNQAVATTALTTAEKS